MHVRLCSNAFGDVRADSMGTFPVHDTPTTLTMLTHICGAHHPCKQEQQRKPSIDESKTLNNIGKAWPFLATRADKSKNGSAVKAKARRQAHRWQTARSVLVTGPEPSSCVQGEQHHDKYQDTKMRLRTKSSPERRKQWKSMQGRRLTYNKG